MKRDFFGVILLNEIIIVNYSEKTMPFRKGQSGNPNGRPQGALNKRTELVKLLESRAIDLMNKAIELALDGDPTTLRICLERLLPKAQPHPSEIDFPIEINKENKIELKRSILMAVTKGQISVSDAEKFMNLIEKHIPCIQSATTYKLNTTDPIEASKIYQSIMTGKYNET